MTAPRFELTSQLQKVFRGYQLNHRGDRNNCSKIAVRYNAAGKRLEAFLKTMIMSLAHTIRDYCDREGGMTSCTTLCCILPRFMTRDRFCGLISKLNHGNSSPIERVQRDCKFQQLYSRIQRRCPEFWCHAYLGLVCSFGLRVV